MNAKQFFDLVSEMRKTQKEYFKTHNQTVLQHSKDLEKLVDKEIERVNKLTTEPELNFG